MEIYSNWDNQQEWDSGNFITTGILHHAIRIKQNDIWVCLKSGHPPETQWFTSHSSKSSWFKDPPSLGNPLYLHWHIYRQYMCISKYRFRYIYIYTYICIPVAGKLPMFNGIFGPAPGCDFARPSSPWRRRSRRHSPSPRCSQRCPAPSWDTLGTGEATDKDVDLGRRRCSYQRKFS